MDLNTPIYILPGLEADHRMYSQILFREFPQAQLIEWVSPDVDDTLANYAAKLLPQIKEEKFILVGFSFGAMLSIEINKIKKAQKIIIVSGVKEDRELPLLFKVIGKIGLVKLLPEKLFTRSNFIKNRLLGIKSNNQKNLDKIYETLPTEKIIQWSFHAVANWRSQGYPDSLVHIHGEEDRILPIKNIHSPVVKVPKAKHLMFFNKSKLVSRLIQEALKN